MNNIEIYRSSTKFELHRLCIRLIGFIYDEYGFFKLLDNYPTKDVAYLDRPNSVCFFRDCDDYIKSCIREEKLNLLL